MLPTPDTSHVAFKTIYEPSEDSYLLLDTLSSALETTFLQNRFPLICPPPVVVEVGTGSGVVIAFVTANAEYIFERPILSLGVDVNVDACLATSQTVKRAITDQQSQSLWLGGIQSDLCTSLRPHTIDVLIFNPPYVPSEQLPALPSVHRRYRDKFEHDHHLLSLSYDGGVDGMETTNRLLAQIPDVLSRRGVAYVLLCAQNKPEDVKTRIRDMPEGPWLVETVGTSGKKAGWEKLVVLRIWRIAWQAGR